MAPTSHSQRISAAHCLRLLYFQSGLRLERILPSSSMLERLQPKPKLKVHDPESAEETEAAVDEILKKIQAKAAIA